MVGEPVPGLLAMLRVGILAAVGPSVSARYIC
jgi:hypothetical protein